MAIQDKKQYNLEDRTLNFAKDIRQFIRKLSKTIANIEDGKQVVRSSGSVGANYIEAKESIYWLKLLHIVDDKDLEAGRSLLIQEATELMMIFGAIMRKSQSTENV